MAIAPNQLGSAVQAYLLQQGKDPRQYVFNYTVMSNENGVRLERWDAAAIGLAQPTLAQLETALASRTALQNAFDRKNDLDELRFRALARAIHVRFGRADATTMSAATWRNILEAAWDAERG